MILLTIVLLFVQANADLALPDYLSKIINIGIQQGGVENAVPEAIRQSEMERLLIFASAEDKALITGSYALVDQNSADYTQYVKEYPALANEPVYVRKDLDQAQIDQLKPVMAKSILVVSSLKQVMADPAKAAAMGQGSQFDLSKLPAGYGPVRCAESAACGAAYADDECHQHEIRCLGRQHAQPDRGRGGQS